MVDIRTEYAGRSLTDLATCCGRVAKDYPDLVAAGEGGKLVEEWRRLQRMKLPPPLNDFETIKTEEESLKVRMIEFLVRYGR